MTRRGFLGASAAAPLLASQQAANSSSSSSSPAAAQTGGSVAGRARGSAPNIVFIMADQMTPFMTGPYGQKVARTPNLDRLAARGTLFQNAYCNSPLCVPSRTSMFSGRLPAPIAAYDNASEFVAANPTFLYYLRKAGYETAVAGKTHFIGPDQFHGFDERLTPCIFPAGFQMLPDWKLGPVYNKGTSIQAMFRMLGPSKWGHQLAFDQLAYDSGIARLRRHATGPGDKGPLFLNISFTQPHDPFTTTKEFLDLYNGVDIPLPHPYQDVRKLSPTYEWFRIHHGLDRETLSDDRVREARRNYLGMISWVDHKIGGILDEITRLGMDDNTVVIFASDHGEMMGEHGQWSKRLLLEWSARVPLIAAGPGISGGRRVNALASLVDLFPTFTDIAGVTVETPVDGKSLLPLLRGEEDGSGPGREVVSEYLGEGAIEPMRMVRQGSHKVITVNGYAPQFYDLERDPWESANLSGRPEYREPERKLLTRAEQNWDGPALKNAVIVSQEKRALIRPMAPKWDYVSEQGGPFQG